MLGKGDRANFDTLRKAESFGRLALVDTTRKSDGARVALVCAVNISKEDGHELVPLAVMVDGDPYELYNAPLEDK